MQYGNFKSIPEALNWMKKYFSGSNGQYTHNASAEVRKVRKKEAFTYAYVVIKKMNGVSDR